MKRWATLLVVVLAAMAPVSASAVVHVYRTDGHICEVGDQTYNYWYTNAHYGLRLEDVTGEASTAVCPILTGTATVTLDDLAYVYVAGATHGATGEDLDVWMVAHDVNSTDYCECDTELDTSSSDPDYWGLTLNYDGAGDGNCDNVSCPGGQVPGADWNVSVLVQLSDHDSGNNYIYIKTLSVYAD